MMAGCIRTVEPTLAKCETGWAAADGKLTVGSIVIHVALAWMRLAPGIFVRGDILRFGEIGRARILRWIQVARLPP